MSRPKTASAAIAAGAMLALSSLLVVGIADPAHAGSAEERILELMEKLRADEASAEERRMTGLHGAYGEATGLEDRRLVSLALGEAYLRESSRLALQYLSSAELSCRPTDPLLPIIRYYKAEAKHQGGAYVEAAATLQSLLDGGELGDAWAKRILSLLIESRYELGDLPGMLTAFRDYTKRYSFSRRQEILAKLAAQAFEKQGDMERATEVLEELARGYPATENSRWAFRRLSELACAKAGARPVYSYSRRLLQHLSRNASLDRGLDAFIAAQATQPLRLEDGTVRLLAPTERADMLFRARLYREALDETLAIYEVEKNQPGSRLLPTLVFEIGRIHMRLADHMASTRWMSLFLEMYPKHPSAQRANEYLGDAFRYLGMPALAAQSYATAVSSTRDGKLMRWYHFWSTFRAKDYAGALSLLERPGYVEPRDGDDQQTVTYWHAKTLERLGRQQEAEGLFRGVIDSGGDNFYSNIVATQYPKLANSPSMSVAAIKATPPPSESADKPGRVALSAKLLAAGAGGDAFPLRPELKLVDDLLRVGMKDTATTQLSSLKWSDYSQQDAFAAVSRLAGVLGDYNSSRRIKYTQFSTLKSIPSIWRQYVEHQLRNGDEWKVYYPLAFDAVVEPVTKRLRLDKFLVLSLMRTESFYNKEARSGVGAQGLMQLMPYTALNIARLLNDQSFDVLDVADPQVNISYGAYYIDKLVRYYGGNQFLAAAAYNGGPTNVNQWLDSCSDCTSDEFVEAIPFRETRRYVRLVMASLSQYGRIYGGVATLPALPRMPESLPEGEEIF